MKIKKTTFLVRHQNKNVKISRNADGDVVSGDAELFSNIASIPGTQIKVIMHGTKGEHVHATVDHTGNYVSGNKDVVKAMKEIHVRRKKHEAPTTPSDHAEGDRHGDPLHDEASGDGPDGDAADPDLALSSGVAGGDPAGGPDSSDEVK